MTKKIILSLAMIFFASSFSLNALAQEANDAVQPDEGQETISAGILPDSPFYFFKALGEDIKAFFTFDVLAKAQRYAGMAQLRIAEMQAMAERTKTKNIEKAAERYQKQLEKSVEYLARAEERNREQEKERINQLEQEIAQNIEGYIAILDGSLGELPQQIKLKIRLAKDASGEVQIQALKLLVKDNPEKAVEIFLTALENRLRKIDVGVDYDDTENADDAVEQYNTYSSFGQEISEMAKGIRVGETTVEELVNTATAHHLQVLEQVRERVNEQAKEKIGEAIEKSKEVKERIEEQIRNRENEEESSGNNENGQEDGVCIQVISYAENPGTGECQQFSTPCDIPDGWEKKDSCPIEDNANGAAGANGNAAGANTNAGSGRD